MSDGEVEEIRGVFRDNERAGHRRFMMTTIEGKGKLAKYMERKRRMDPEARAIDSMENYIYQMKDYYEFSVNYLDTIINLFENCPNKFMKNPYAFVLGYILYIEKDIDVIRKILVGTSEFIGGALKNQKGTERPVVSDVDVIRYSRLIEKLSNNIK